MPITYIFGQKSESNPFWKALASSCSVFEKESVPLLPKTLAKREIKNHGYVLFNFFVRETVVMQRDSRIAIVLRLLTEQSFHSK